MNNIIQDNDVDRLLCSSVLLNNNFRKAVLKHFSKKYKAVAPEIGVNIRNLLLISIFSRNRQIKYNAILCIPGLFIIASFYCIFTNIPDNIIGPLLIISILFSWSICFYKKFEEFFLLGRHFQRGLFSSQEIIDTFDIDEDISKYYIPSDKSNVIIHEGADPFVGAGTSLGGWSFVIDIGKTKDVSSTDKKTPIKRHDIYKKVCDSITSSNVGKPIIDDYIFIHGLDVENNKDVLPNRIMNPVQTLGIAEFDSYILNSDFISRHYKWIRSYQWDNHVVTSCIFRCIVESNDLFIELNRYVLAPIESRYYKIDLIPPKDLLGYTIVSVTSLVMSPFNAILSILDIIYFLLEQIIGKLKNAGFDIEDIILQYLVRINVLFNYGSTTSVRAFVADKNIKRLFQKYDVDMFFKAFEQRLLYSIRDYLDENNIDTSDFSNRQTTIMNNGVFIQSGNINHSVLAVGSNSMAYSEGKRRRFRFRRTRL